MASAAEAVSLPSLASGGSTVFDVEGVRWRDVAVSVHGASNAHSAHVAQTRPFGGGVFLRTAGGDQAADAAAHGRFLVFRCVGEVLELTEHSLECTLADNAVRYRFPFRILPSVSFVEERSGGPSSSPTAIHVLLATERSVHRLSFAHPASSSGVKRAQGRVLSVLSPALGAPHTDAHVALSMRLGGGAGPGEASPYVIATAASPSSVVIGCANGALVHVAFAAGHAPEETELAQSSLVRRLWSGMLPSFIAGGVGASARSRVTGLAVVSIPGADILIAAASADSHLRVWSLGRRECVQDIDLGALWMRGGLGDVAEDAEGPCSHLLRYVSMGSSQRVLAALRFGGRTAIASLDVDVHGLQPLAEPSGLLTVPTEAVLDYCVAEGVEGLRMVVITCAFDAGSDGGYRDGDGGEATWVVALSSQTWLADGDWAQVAADDGLRAPSVPTLGGGEDDASLLHHQPDDAAEEGDAHGGQRRVDAQEYYLGLLFAPGRFGRRALARGIHAFGGRVGAQVLHGLHATHVQLRDEAVAAVYADVALRASSGEITAEQYRRLVRLSWESLFRGCDTFARLDLALLGCFADAGGAGVFAVRRAALTALRPADPTESVACAAAGAPVSPTGPLAAPSIDGGVVDFVRAASLLASALGDNALEAFEEDVWRGTSAVESATRALWPLCMHGRIPAGNDSPHSASELPMRLWDALSRLRSFAASVDGVLRLVEGATASNGGPEGIASAMLIDDAQQRWSSPNSARLATQFASATVNGILGLRYRIARNSLLLLCMVLNGIQEPFKHPFDRQAIVSSYLPRMSRTLRHYATLHWLSRQHPVPIAPATGAVTTGLAAMTLGEGKEAVLDGHVDILGESALSLYVAHAYADTRHGLEHTRGLDSVGFGEEVLASSLSILRKLEWSCTRDGPTPFVEFLLSKQQTLIAEDLIRMVDTATPSLVYYLGHCLAASGEFHKASDCLVRAAAGFDSANVDAALWRVAGVDGSQLRHGGSDVDRSMRAEGAVRLLLRGMRLFEERRLPGIAMGFASAALGKAGALVDDSAPILWSNVFKYGLDLGDYDKAYTAMISNPDLNRRRDCLRRFVAVLSERRELAVMCRMPYAGLEGDVESALLFTARNSDVTSIPNPYEFLFAFHVHRGNYRQAGSVMYECAQRLGVEAHPQSVDSLQQQAKAFLASRNALRLSDPSNAWIVVPREYRAGQWNKRKRDGSVSAADELAADDDEAVTIVEAPDVDRMYAAVLARLTLAQSGDGVPPASITPAEALTLLLRAGQIDTAVSHARLYGLDLAPVFDALAARCVGVDGSVVSDGSDDAWSLLRNLLERYDGREGNYGHHQRAADRILAADGRVALPAWLVASFKRKNAPALLSLYVKHDRLIDAAHLAIDYMVALTAGVGTDTFGAKNALHGTEASVWLPHALIERLFAALGDAGAYSQDHLDARDQLRHGVAGYLKCVRDASGGVRMPLAR